MPSLLDRRTRPTTAVAVVAALAALTGCAGAAEDGAARRTAEEFAGAVRAGDGETVCRLLAPTARTAVEDTSGRPCPAGVVEQAGWDAGAVTDVALFGTSAQVQLEGDTLFLVRDDDGWRVLGAACTPHGAGPYDCRVDGS